MRPTVTPLVQTDALVEQRSQTPCTCVSGCDCHDHYHDNTDKHDHKNQRFPWLSSRLGRATSKGVGWGLISTIIFTPCPCCGGVLLACLRGLLSAAIGLIVGIVAYKRRPATDTQNESTVSSDVALEQK